MTQEFLDNPHIGPGIQQVSGKGVTDFVRRQVFREISQAQVDLHPLLDPEYRADGSGQADPDP